MPPKPGTFSNTYASESLSHFRTRGSLVHIAVYSFSFTPAISGRFAEEFMRHGARLVDIEIDIDAMPFGAIDKTLQVLQSLFMSFAELREHLSARRELPQHRVQPDSVDALSAKPGQQAIGKRIQLRIRKRVAEHGKIRVDIPQRFVRIERLVRGAGSVIACVKSSINPNRGSAGSLSCLPNCIAARALEFPPLGDAISHPARGTSPVHTAA